MLELRPICEHCNVALPTESLEVRTCLFECTLCATCVEKILGNVCSNCGDRFVPRPVRSLKNWRGDNVLGAYPASTTVKHRPVDLKAHAQFAERVNVILQRNRSWPRLTKSGSCGLRSPSRRGRLLTP